MVHPIPMEFNQKLKHNHERRLKLQPGFRVLWSQETHQIRQDLAEGQAGVL